MPYFFIMRAAGSGGGFLIIIFILVLLFSLLPNIIIGILDPIWTLTKDLKDIRNYEKENPKPLLKILNFIVTFFIVSFFMIMFLDQVDYPRGSLNKSFENDYFIVFLTLFIMPLLIVMIIQILILAIKKQIYKDRIKEMKEANSFVNTVFSYLSNMETSTTSYEKPLINESQPNSLKNELTNNEIQLEEKSTKTRLSQDLLKENLVNHNIINNKNTKYAKVFDENKNLNINAKNIQEDELLIKSDNKSMQTRLFEDLLKEDLATNNIIKNRDVRYKKAFDGNKNINIDTKNIQGDTLLIVNIYKYCNGGMEYNYLETIELLLQNGADPNIHSYTIKSTPLKYVKNRGYSVDGKLVSLLLKYGAKEY